MFAIRIDGTKDITEKKQELICTRQRAKLASNGFSLALIIFA